MFNTINMFVFINNISELLTRTNKINKISELLTLNNKYK